MSSWAGLTVWSIMTVLEFVGKCVPVIDQMVDSVEVFVVPWIVSTLARFFDNHFLIFDVCTHL